LTQKLTSLPLCSQNFNISFDFCVGKKVLVMGLGRFGGGIDVVRFLHKAGAAVTVTDLSSKDKLTESINQLKDCHRINFLLGGHQKSDFENADIIIANPAVPPGNEFLQIARKNKKLVTSQIEIFFQLCPAKIIGITGSNGKSTTAALTVHLLKNVSDEQRATSNHNVWLSGNIGNQPMLMLLDDIEPDDLVVLELSSFQLEQLAQIKKAPHVSLLTNLTPNHLDRHKTFENYCSAKENIFKFQKLDENNPAVSIFNAEEKKANQWFEKYNNVPGRICLKFSADDVTDDIKNCFELPGRANLANLAAAVAIVKYFGLDEEQIKKTLPAFKALPHRLQLVAEKNGICWYNDSKATTPESTIVALESFDKPIILIAGGFDKNIGFDSLGLEIAKRAKAAILIGRTAPKIASAIRVSSIVHQVTKILFVDSLADAVTAARNLAERGDIVLLSPACASYDMFENYEHRGYEFSRLVTE